MTERVRLVAYYIAAVVSALAVFALAYNYGMRTFESDPQPLVNSLEVVFQTFTTVGYGEDAPWRSPVMNLLVIGMQATGVVLIFAALPVFVVPLIEDALTTTPPTVIEALSDHVVICTYTPRGEALIAELDRWGADYVVVEADRETATELHESGYTVVHGDPESTAVLEDARVTEATAVVADGTNEVNASIVLAARETTEEVQVLSIVDDQELTAYHRYAGADRVLSPRQLLGEHLASKVTAAVSTELSEGATIDGDFYVVELPIYRESALAGRTLDEHAIDEMNVTVVGGWIDDDFVSPLPSDTVIGVGTVLLVIGNEARLRRFKELTLSEANLRGRGRFIVAGLGEVGSAVANALETADADVSWGVLDIEDKAGVDIVCDATDPGALREAAIEEARTVILALDDDTTTMLATLIARELNSEAFIVARANEAENVAKLNRAGADYVRSLAGVSGRMIAWSIYEDEPGAALDERSRVVRTHAPALAGQTLAEAEIRTRTGVTVIAIERDGEVITDIDSSSTLRADDEIVVVGVDEDIDQFESLAL
jgi:Trk K+ transport system NAD-binding subunit